MQSNFSFHSLRAFFLSLTVVIGLFPSLARGESDEGTAELFNGWQEQTSASSRAPKPLSQTAENVTVITTADIRTLNAHTLADILDTVPGIQLQHNGGPGITTYTFIQSTDYIFTQVFIDGISLSNLSSNFPDVSSIPANIIDRVEIVKGAASASWGSALGGVINVITKSPEPDRAVSGSASASIGKNTTADTNAELSGSSGKLGYYLSGGYLGSNGLLPTMQIGSNHAYAKLTYALPNQGLLWGTYFYTHVGMGDLYVPIPDYDLKERRDQTQQMASFGLRSHLAAGLELELTGRHSFNSNSISYFNISDNLPWLHQTPDPPLPITIIKEQISGGSVKLTWNTSQNLLVAGSDYNHQGIESNTPDGNVFSPYSRTVDRWGIYLNDTLKQGPLSLSPSVRLDHIQTGADQPSYSLGVTCQANDTTLLRIYSGRGFGLPTLVATDPPTTQIWTTQLGIESSAVQYLWLKGTLFRNVITGSGIAQQVTIGSELEFRTVPVFNTSLGAGYTFSEATSGGSMVESSNLARHTLQLALRYNDKVFRGVLNGRYIYWDSSPDDNSKSGMLWDLHLGATLFKQENSSLELFFSGHNLFNSAQYNRDVFPNVGRWFDGGIRVNF